MVLRLSDIPDPTSAMREHVLRLRAWANHEADPGEHLRRGAVYWYTFRETRVESGEVYKRRPVLVMNENPAWCKRMNRALNVIPLSSQEDRSHRKDSSVPITIDDVTRYAVIAQATTINSRRLEEYVGQLDSEQLDNISRLLRQNIMADFGEPKPGHVTPANVFELSWHDMNSRRPFCVLSDNHLVDPKRPVEAMPLSEDHFHEDFLQSVTPRPVSSTRFDEKEAAFIGTLPTEIFERLRTRYARQFGL